MDKHRLKRALAITALVFIFIFTVSFVVFLAVPDILNGALGYLCLITFLFGVGLFIIVKYILKDKEPPEYLPSELPDDGDETDDEANVGEDDSENSLKSDDSDASDRVAENGQSVSRGDGADGDD